MVAYKSDFRSDALPCLNNIELELEISAKEGHDCYCMHLMCNNLRAGTGI